MSLLILLNFCFPFAYNICLPHHLMLVPCVFAPASWLMRHNLFSNCLALYLHNALRVVDQPLELVCKTFPPQLLGIALMIYPAILCSSAARACCGVVAKFFFETKVFGKTKRKQHWHAPWALVSALMLNFYWNRMFEVEFWNQIFCFPLPIPLTSTLLPSKFLDV